MLQCQKLIWVQKAITQIHGSKIPSRVIKFKDSTSVSGKSLRHSLLEFGTACQGTITACLPLSYAVPQASAVVYVWERLLGWMDLSQPAWLFLCLDARKSILPHPVCWKWCLFFHTRTWVGWFVNLLSVNYCRHLQRDFKSEATQTLLWAECGSMSPKHEKKQGVYISLALRPPHMLIPDLMLSLQGLSRWLFSDSQKFTYQKPLRHTFRSLSYGTGANCRALCQEQPMSDNESLLIHLQHRYILRWSLHFVLIFSPPADASNRGRFLRSAASCRSYKRMNGRSQIPFPTKAHVCFALPPAAVRLESSSSTLPALDESPWYTHSRRSAFPAHYP